VKRRPSIKLLGRVSIGSAIVGLTLPAKTNAPAQAEREDGRSHVNARAPVFPKTIGSAFEEASFTWLAVAHEALLADRSALGKLYPEPSFARTIIPEAPKPEGLPEAFDPGKLESVGEAFETVAIAQHDTPIALKLPEIGLAAPALDYLGKPGTTPDASDQNQQVLETDHTSTPMVRNNAPSLYRTPLEPLYVEAEHIASVPIIVVHRSELPVLDAGEFAENLTSEVDASLLETTTSAIAIGSLPAELPINRATVRDRALTPVVPETSIANVVLTVSDLPSPASEINEPDDDVTIQQSGQTETDLTPGRQAFPVEQSDPLFDYDDELILQLRVASTSATETIIAYGTRSGVYLPLGEMARLLDLPIQVSDDGHYASGWFLSEERTLTVDLRQSLIVNPEGTSGVERTMAQAFDGELFLRADVMASLFPLEIETDLRSQAVILTTLEPFPFEERMRRRAERDRLNLRTNRPEPERWPREETPWAALSVPMADLEIRAVSDTARGIRGETDIRLAGDLAFLTAQSFISATTRDGLTAAIVELGRRDADADLLGPLEATEFSVGDVATRAMPLGLRGASGRGAFVSNQSFDGISVFDEIDFRGVLPSGYEVELYRNDVLLGSTQERVNGQYEFLQIPVDYGLNVFRLVFYGPQGQRREEVRRVSVGDGRLAPGKFEYTAGTVQRGVNLLGVEGPDFRPDIRFGDWQVIGEVAYGLSSDITASASAAFFEELGQQRWIATAGVRTGIGGLAVRGDVGVSDGGGNAFGFGLGGRALGGGFKLTHFEYSGPFIDEVRAIGSQPLERATELDFNTSLGLGGDTYLPITFRGRRTEYQDGRTQTNAIARASLRLPGIISSNTLSYSNLSAPETGGFAQLVGNFDLATFNRSSTQIRGSVGYRVHPDPMITQIGAEVSRAIDDRTVVRASAAYTFENGGAVVGLSAIREFDRFTLALDSQYDFERNDHAVALRVNLSFGRDPLRGQFFVARPGMASSGSAAVRAFHDLDGDRVFGPGDTPLPDVIFSASNNTAQTDENGLARLGDLGNGNRAVIQVDPSSLPDIFMAPVTRGVEIVPRAGRFHTTDFAIIELSEVEGTVNFAEDSNARGVSGLRLQMVDKSGEVIDFVRTERGGYFFFERVQPGTYELIIEPEQAARLNLCLASTEDLRIGNISDILSVDLTVATCNPDAPEI